MQADVSSAVLFEVAVRASLLPVLCAETVRIPHHFALPNRDNTVQVLVRRQAAMTRIEKGKLPLFQFQNGKISFRSLANGSKLRSVNRAGRIDCDPLDDLVQRHTKCQKL